MLTDLQTANDAILAANAARSATAATRAVETGKESTDEVRKQVISAYRTIVARVNAAGQFFASDVITKFMALKLMTRRLIVKGTLVGIDLATIKSIDVTQNGVSNARRINGGVVTKSIASRADNTAATSYYVTNETQPALDGTFSTSFNLLGINPEVAQKLHIIVTFNNGKTFTYEQNVSTLLAGFNTASYETSVGLDATINFGLGGVSGTIIDWTPGWNESGLGE